MTSSLADIIFDEPILVTGTPRSGKTFLTGLLSQAHEFAFLPEPLPIWDIGMRETSHDCRLPDEATEQVVRRIRRAIDRALRRAGKPRYLDELAYHALRIRFVHRVLPEARIVHVVRDPVRVIPEMTYWWTRHDDTPLKAFARRRRDIQLHTLPRLIRRFVKNYVHSRIRGRPAFWGPRVPGLREFSTAHGPAETAAYQWRKLVEIARADLDQLPASQWLEVRYESILERPSDEFKRIARFCRLENPDEVGRAAQSYVNPEHPPFATVVPCVSEWTAIREQIEATARQLGYKLPLRMQTQSPNE